MIHIVAFALSPLGRWLNERLADLTSSWAIAAVLIVLIIGVIGIKLGGYQMRNKMVTLCIVAVFVLLVQAFVWLAVD